MKTLEQKQELMDQARKLWLSRERIYLLAKELSDTLEKEVEELETAYEKSKRDVDMHEEDEIELAESRQDLEDDLSVTNTMQE